MKKRLMSILLSVCMALSLLPAGALADATAFTGGMTAAVENDVLWLFANGKAVTIETKGSGTAIYADNNGTTAEIDLASVTSGTTKALTANSDNGYDLSAVVVCGGSNKQLGTSDSSIGTSVTMNGGTVGALVGGCYGVALYGSTNVKLTGGKLNGVTLETGYNPQAIVGGGVNGSVKGPTGTAGAFSGDTHVSISGGTIAESGGKDDTFVLCTAGCWGSGSTLPTVDNAYLTITGQPALNHANNHIYMAYYSKIAKAAYLNITPSVTLENGQIYALNSDSAASSVTSANILTNNKNCITTSGNDGFTSDAHYLTVDTTNTNYDFTSVNTSFTLGTDYTIPAGYTMTIPTGVTLTIPSGVTVINNGSIVINGTLVNNGTINTGTDGSIVNQGGTYTPGSGATPQTVDSVVPDFTGLTITAGSTRGTTKISAIGTVTTSGNTQYYKLFDTQPAAPSGSTAAITNPTSDGYVTVDTSKDITVRTGQYLAVYELDSSKKIVKYHCEALTDSNIKDSTAYDSLTSTISAGSASNTTKITAEAGSGETLYYKLGDTAEGTGYVYNTPISLTGLTQVPTGDISATAGQYLSVYEVTAAEPHLLHGFACVKLTSTNFTAYTGGLVAVGNIIYCNGATVCMSAETYDSTAHTGSEPMLYVWNGTAWKAATPLNLTFSGGTSYAGYTLSSKSSTDTSSTTKSGTLYLISNPYFADDYTALPKVDDSWKNAIYPTGRASGTAITMTDKNCTDYTVVGAIDPSASKQTHLYNYASASNAIYNSVSTAARTRADNSVKRMDINSLTVADGGTFTVPSAENGAKPSDTFKVLFFGNRNTAITGTGSTVNIQNMIFMPKVDIKLYRADTMTELPYTTRDKTIESTGNKIYQIPNNIPVTIVATFAASAADASASAAPSTQMGDLTTAAAGSQIPLAANYALGFYVATTEAEGNMHFWYYTNDKLNISKSTADADGNYVTTVSVTVKDLQKYTEFTKSNSSANTWYVYADVSNITDGNTSFAAYIPPRYYDTRRFCQFELLKSEQAPLTVSGLGGHTYGDKNFSLSVGGGSSNGAVTYSVPDNNGVLSTDGSTLTAIGAGTAKVTVTKAGDDTYEPVTKTVELTVAKKTPTAAELTMTPASAVYDGSAKSAAVTAKDGLTGFGTVSAPYYKNTSGSIVSPTDVGTYTVYVDVGAGDNYIAATGVSAGTFTITKKTDVAAPTITAIDDSANTLTFTPVTGANVYEYSADNGKSWLPCSDTDSSDSAVTISVGNVAGAVQVRAKETANNAAGQTATSEAFTATLEGGVSISGTAEYGQTLTANVSGAQANAVFTYQWKLDGADIENATGKTYTLTGDVIGKPITVAVSAAPYVGTLTSTATAAVSKGTPSGAPAYTAITTSGKTLADAALKIGTLQPDTTGYTLVWVDADGKTLPDTTAVAANTSYKWLFTPKDTANYDVLSGSVTLYPVSSTGGGGGGGSTETPTTKNETSTVTNTDGSTTKTDTTTKTDSTGATTTTEVKTTTNTDGTTTKVETATTKKTDTATGAVTETTTQKTVDAAGKTEVVEQAKTTVTDKTTGAKTEIVAEAKTTADGTTTKVETVKVAGGKDGVTAEAKVETAKTGEAVATATVEAPADAKAATLPAAVVEAVTKADTANVTVKVGEVSVALDKTAVEAVKATGGEAPVISATPVAAKELPAELQSATKAYDFKVSGKGVNFGGGSAVVSVPYTKADSNKAIAVYHIDANGNKTRVYDAKLTAGTLNIPTVGWSTYAVLEVAPLAFTDVKDTDWFYGSVQYAVDNNLFKGTSATTFSPNVNMTRGMLVTVLWRMAGSPAMADYGYPYGDVNAKTNEFAPAIYWARDQKLVNGYSDDKFGPDDAVTREQMVSILYRYAALKKYDTTQGGMAIREYSDYASISSYAATAMDWGVNAGLLNGSDGKLNPASGASRAEVAAILMRFGQKLAK